MKIDFNPEELEAIKARLTDREAVVLELYYKRGWPIEEIAAEIDRNRRTVDRILNKIRRKAFR